MIPLVIIFLYFYFPITIILSIVIGRNILKNRLLFDRNVFWTMSQIFISFVLIYIMHGDLIFTNFCGFISTVIFFWIVLGNNCNTSIFDLINNITFLIIFGHSHVTMVTVLPFLRNFWIKILGLYFEIIRPLSFSLSDIFTYYYFGIN